MLAWIWVIPALPLAGFVLLAPARRLPRAIAAWIGSGSVGLAMVASAAAGLAFAASPAQAVTVTVWKWFEVGDLVSSISFSLDALSLVMILVVTTVGFLIHVYSARFMAGEEGYSRFFAYMNLFVASMLILVLADNFVLLYLGWEGVGLCSYLLIGFWYTDPANGRAARKAFIVTRIGDVALAIGLFLIWSQLGSLDIQEAARRAATTWAPGSAIATWAAALLLGGAVGKSAQLPLQTWLPDAMAGPTPVSALIHAATMVTAGVYLIARSNALFILAPDVMMATAIIGAAGLIVAGLSATTQTDIKRVLAYSTMSQLGYMFLALGVGAWSAAIFHLLTHALFKSLLFLSAGVVILAMDHEHNISVMGGLARKLPFTFVVFLVGAFALTSLPPVTAGFSSKDMILALTYEAPGGRTLWAIAEAGVLVTSFYTFRLVFLVFLGKPRALAHGAEAPGHDGHPAGPLAGPVMGPPLAILAFLCLIAGFLNLPRTLGGVPYLASFLHNALPPETQSEPSIGTEAMLQGLSEGASLLGALAAWLAVRRRLRGEAPRQLRGLVHAGNRYLFSGWGFDAIYDRLFVRPFNWIARVNARDVVDLLAVGVGGLSMAFSRLFRSTQTGRIRWYAAGLALGAVLVVAAAVAL
jgi:NADH-quinone oxidoreductase subunit L